MKRLTTTKELHTLRRLNVMFEDQLVGTLALSKDGLTAFEYSDNWLINGFSLNPLSLPLEKRVFIPKHEPFDGLFGVFNESLPDGWGWLLVDRMLKEQGIDPSAIHRLARLAIVGNSGMGALTYEPELDSIAAVSIEDLDILANKCAQVLDAKPIEDLDELFMLGGSSGGARPKILTDVDGEAWIIKFPARIDRTDIGLMEYEYSNAAKACGIEMPETRLFSSKLSPGYFGVKRFDRSITNGKTKRTHMASVSALLETTHRIPNLDYQTIAKLLIKLTSSMEEVHKVFKQMCFNVLSHNQDDHSKNFALLYNNALNVWSLSPAFDLTYSAGMMGERATTVMGKGKDISTDDLYECGIAMGVSRKSCIKTIQEVKEVAVPLAEKWR